MYTSAGSCSNSPAKYLLVLFFSMVSANLCPPPSEGCVDNRKCAFGTIAKYREALDQVAMLTGCDNCANVCGPCQCDSSNSAVQKAIDNKEFCNSSICRQPEVTHMMGFFIDNFDTCENEVLRIQPLLIQLCGAINGQCCQGNCQHMYQISTPPSLCDQLAGVSPPARWLMTAYTVIALLLAQWAYDSVVE
jgi:hypothetical protein